MEPTRISTAELYDNKSVIVKLKRIEDKVDGAEQSVLAHVSEAQEASTDAQTYAGQAQAAAQGMSAIRDQAQASATQAGQSASTAQAVLTEVRQTAAQAENTARTVATEVVNEKTQTMKSEITAELGTDIEEAKDKADLAYTTASGFSGAIASMQSAVNSTQQEMSNVRTTAQNASQQATQTQGNLDLFKTQAANTYATKTELNGKADTTTVDTLTQTVSTKLTKTEADGYYQPIGDYLTETVADGKYQPKGEYGASVWGQITGNVEDQTDMIRKMQALDSDVESRAETYATEAIGELETEMYEELAKKQNVGNYALKSEIPDVSGLETSAHAQATYQPKGEYVTKGEIAGVYTFRGTKSTKAQLPDEGNIVGDVWNVASTGMNYAWDGNDWDALGTEIDLSGYQEKLTPGDGITIEDNVISASGGAGVTGVTLTDVGDINHMQLKATVTLADGTSVESAPFQLTDSTTTTVGTGKAILPRGFARNYLVGNTSMFVPSVWTSTSASNHHCTSPAIQTFGMLKLKVYILPQFNKDLADLENAYTDCIRVFVYSGSDKIPHVYTDRTSERFDIEVLRETSSYKLVINPKVDYMVDAKIVYFIDEAWKGTAVTHDNWNPSSESAASSFTDAQYNAAVAEGRITPVTVDPSKFPRYSGGGLEIPAEPPNVRNIQLFNLPQIWIPDLSSTKKWFTAWSSAHQPAQYFMSGEDRTATMYYNSSSFMENITVKAGKVYCAVAYTNMDGDQYGQVYGYSDGVWTREHSDKVPSDIEGSIFGIHFGLFE